MKSGVVRMAILGFSQNPAERWVPGGTLIFVFLHNIAEMNVSEPDKKHFQFKKKIRSAEVENFCMGIR